MRRHTIAQVMSACLAGVFLAFLTAAGGHSEEVVIVDAPSETSSSLPIYANGREDCDPFTCGVGGWTLYWYDLSECNSPCHCQFGYWNCPSGTPARFYGSVEFLPLFRDQLTNDIFAAKAQLKRTITTTQTGSGTTAVTTTTETDTVTRTGVLSDSDLGSAFDPGTRITLGLALNDWWRVEGSYLGSYSWGGIREAHWENNAANTEVGNLLSPFSNFGDGLQRPGLPVLVETKTTVGSGTPVTSGDLFEPVTGLDYNETIRVAYTSDFVMGDINLRRRLSNISTTRVAAEVSLLAGFRAMRLSETLDFMSISPLPTGAPATNSVLTKTGNELYGPQIGALAQFLVSPRSWIDLDFKGAILLGNSECQFTVNGTALPWQSQFVTAFLGDLSMQYNFQVTQSLTVKAGYNAFFLNGVALAGDNLTYNQNTLMANLATLDHQGRIVYHGPSIGLVFAR